MEEIPVILAFGVPGVGKSTVLNYLLGDEECTTFKAARAVKGVTREVIKVEGKYLGRLGKIQVIDVPGVGDPTFPTKIVLKQLEDVVRSTALDIILWVMKASDDRMTLGESILAELLRLVNDFNPANVVLVITRCDQEREELSADFIQSKVGSINEQAGRILIDPSRVVRFRLSIASLEEAHLDTLFRVERKVSFEQNLVRGFETKVVPALTTKIEEFANFYRKEEDNLKKCGSNSAPDWCTPGEDTTECTRCHFHFCAYHSRVNNFTIGGGHYCGVSITSVFAELI